MAYKIKQENYTKRPSAEMRKLWTEAWAMPLSTIPPTRIEFSLKVKEMLAGPDGRNLKTALKAWRDRRQAAREARRAAVIAAQTPRVEEARNA